MENQPMLADGMNEEGLGVAGLNFPEYAYYEPEIDENKENVSVYDFMFWILANFKDLSEVREALNRFVRVAFLRHNALANDSESMDINEFSIY